ncbi:MAG: hypothetical protein ACRCZF_24705 [Gemmataceae bacterium]
MISTTVAVALAPAAVPASAPATNPVLFRTIGPILIVFLTLIIFAHGCHGEDVDHEPTIVPPVSEGHVP